MRRRRVLVILAGAAALWGAGPMAVPGGAAAWAVPAARGTVPAAGSWSRAIAVPGLAALNKGGDAAVNQVSCGSAGSCAAGGFYADRDGHDQGFVASEKNGAWGQAIKVPGLAALNKGGFAEVSSVSCSLRRNCAAGGFYMIRDNQLRGFVVSDRNGVWGKAIKVPGLAALGRGVVGSVSCASAGNCVAGGYYLAGRQHGFVVSERNGVWGQAIEVPGLGTLTDGRRPASVQSVSCGSAGNCAAGGFYRNRRTHNQGFVVSEQNGVWGQAIKVPGLAALGQYSGVGSVSCPSAGSCAAGGGYAQTLGQGQGFVVSEQNGIWGQAIAVPGLAALNKGVNARVLQVSCASAGNCAAGGSYLDGSGHQQGFVVSQTNGVWGKAIEVPGLGTLNKGRLAEVISVSCAAPGSCAAGGTYRDQQRRTQGFVVREKNGVWGKAIEVPGLGTLNKAGFAEVSSVSCAPAGSCAAGGYYTDRRSPRRFQGFVT